MLDHHTEWTVPGDSRIAGYGIRDAAHHHRAHSEPESEVWPAFELDRRRVIGCSAFRRLQYKTQVFVAPGDHFRTRLTHTLEVAGVARRLALGLGINSTLAEVVALAHDLGHPPFGHAGERALDDMMGQAGGFEHNAQSLRVVEYLEHPCPEFRGLNLTLEVREALARHHTAYDRPRDIVSTDSRLNTLLADTPSGTLEGQVADISDRVAYDCHDLEDAIGAGIIDMDDLNELALWRRCAGPVLERYAGVSLFALWRPAIERVQRCVLDDVVHEVQACVLSENITTVEQVRDHDAAIVRLSSQMNGAIEELEGFLRERVYAHADLRAADDRAADQVRRLFAAYLDRPGELPERFAARIDEQGLYRVVCDYVAGMTDRFCAAECAKFGHSAP